MARNGIATISVGSVEDAQVAIERLLGITGAAYERSSQLQQALSSRVVIEQAKGVLAERYAIDVEDAFATLRQAARTHRMKIHHLAAAVVASRTTPPELAELIER